MLYMSLCGVQLIIVTERGVSLFCFYSGKSFDQRFKDLGVVCSFNMPGEDFKTWYLSNMVYNVTPKVYNICYW